MQKHDFSFLTDPKHIRECDIVISLLLKLFIKDPERLDAEVLRGKYGVLCGILGIFLNLLLFAGKLAAGLLTGAISITADAFNNLSDAGSSVITLLGFRLAGHKADSDHPFGHGRIEYLSGLLVSILIILVGFELGKSSVEKIISPEPVEFSVLSVVILAASIAVKLYMAFYNKRIGRKIASPAMEATALDSLSDSVATAAVLVCMLLSHFFSLEIDAYCGLAVALFIFVSGIRSAKETISPLLGQPPTAEFVQQIHDIVMANKSICGIHDLVVHDYGPGRVMISLHAEVPAHGDILALHDEIDNVEKELHDRLGCEAVIHMDPIVTNDEAVNAAHEKIAALVRSIDENISIHDFRMVTGPTHTNVIFDAVVPYRCKMSDREAEEKIKKAVHELDPHYFAVVQIDKSYVM